MAKLIKDLGSIDLSNSSKKKIPTGIYECPNCGKHIRRTHNRNNTHPNARCMDCKYSHVNDRDETYSILYSRWSGMKNRCYNKNSSDYPKYGQRGVYVCKEWLESFESYRLWAIANGFSKELEIDKDMICNDKSIYPKVYSPSTCQWVTTAENQGYDKYTDDSIVVGYDKDTCKLNYTYSNLREASLNSTSVSTNISRAIRYGYMTGRGMFWRKYPSLEYVLEKIPFPNNPKNKNVYQFTKDMKFINSYDSVARAVYVLGLKRSAISSIVSVCLKTPLPSGNPRKSAFGFVWLYELPL